MTIIKTHVFQVDDLIAPYIIELNNKGYETDFCCSGHEDELEQIGKDTFTMGTYVSFSRTGGITLQTIPDNWYNDSNKNNVIMRRYFNIEELNNKTSEQLLDIAMKELSEWIDTLKYRYTYGYLTMDKI